MKKLNFIVLGTLLAISLATQALADTTIPWTKEGCESVKGTWITAHSPDESGCEVIDADTSTPMCNGKNFCRSPNGMNFWSAVIWCKSIGRTLAPLSSACPKIYPNGTCANLKGKISSGNWNWNSWLNTPYSSNRAYVLVSNTSTLDSKARTYNTEAETKALFE